jgi:uncharacterized lipoprotein YbaY
MSKITIRGWIQLPASHLFDGAVAIVGLDDVTRIDAPSIRVAETIIEPICGSRDRIPFCMTSEGDLSARKSYVLAAEIRCSGEERLRPGDFLTTVAVPWTVGGTHGNIVEVSRI